MGNADAAHIEVLGLEDSLQAEQIGIVGDSQIAAHLILFDILRADYDNDLYLIGQLHQHPQLAVRLKARQNTGRVIIVVELSAEFQIQLIVKLGDTLPDMLRLHSQIFVIVKSFSHVFSPVINFSYDIKIVSIPQKGDTAAI